MSSHFELAHKPMGRSRIPEKLEQITHLAEVAIERKRNEAAPQVGEVLSNHGNTIGAKPEPGGDSTDGNQRNTIKPRDWY
jgi:hypothetical protein